MENNIGALWVKQGTKGDFYKGYIDIEDEHFATRINIVVFKNEYKKADNQPDYRILKAQQKQETKVEEQVSQDDDLPF